jgi:hypothetical protein
LNGLISLPRDFTLAGKVLDLDIAGVKQAFTLNEKSKAKVANASLSFKKPKNKRVQDGSFTVIMKKGSFADRVIAAGLNKDANGLPTTLAIRARFNDKDFLRLVPVKFIKTATKSKAKFGVF